jgi:hypothetical protein
MTRRESRFATLGVFMAPPSEQAVGQLVFAAHLGRAFGSIDQLPYDLQFEFARKRATWHGVPRFLSAVSLVCVPQAYS